MAEALKAPFPHFGGKSRIAAEVWKALGDVDNYIEPFFGSGAVMLARPTAPRIETANDFDCYLANFWRATAHDPEKVVAFADGPVNEADLHARHRWLVLSDDAELFRRRMRTDPDYYDCKVAGWWVWGICCWIGSGWCVEATHRRRINLGGHEGQAGKGVHSKGPLDSFRRPQLADAYDVGRGVHASPPDGYTLWQQAPYMGTGTGQGVNASAGGGTCAARRAWLLDWFGRLRDRFRVTRVCCGHWLRVCDSPSVTTRLGTVGLFLDPPYPRQQKGRQKSRDSKLYATDSNAETVTPEALRDEVLAYCRERGGNRLYRIVVAGYEGDGYEELVAGHGWTETAWQAQGGYGNRSEQGKANAKRERLWLSPHCLRERSLFEGAA